jgi:protein-glutamine gamma-glutamyltransferase
MKRLAARLRSPTLLQAQQLSGSLAVLCAFSAAAASGDLGWPLSALLLASLPLALLWGRKAARRFAAVWTALLFGALVVLASQVLSQQSDIVLAAARFALLLAVHRLWNRADERDEILLLLLSLLLLCGGAALSSELLFGFAFCGYAIAATWALALTHLRFQIEGAAGPQDPQVLLRSRRLITPALLAALAGLSLVGLFGATALFFVFPRVTIGGLRRTGGGAPVAGLGESVDLSGHGAIADDPRVVLRVTLDPDPGPAAHHLDYHFRARAFEIWTGHGWRSRDGHPTPATRLPQPPAALRKGGLWLTATIEAISGGSDGLVLTPPGWPVAVRFNRPLTARGSQYHLLRDTTGDLFYQPVEVGDLQYTISLEPLAGLPEEGPPIDRAQLDEVLRQDLLVPKELDPRIRRLAEKLVLDKPAVKAAASVRDFLESSYAYTRELEAVEGDPVADFLFRRRRGHCELFSSAMVMILRAGGVPARNVTGYYGGVRTDAGYYAVRAGDAHSWVEAWLPGLGWMPFDPTPPAERGSSGETLYAKAVLLWDGLAARWRSQVVDFDLLSQARAAQHAMELLQEAGRKLSGKGTAGAAGVTPRRAGILGVLLLLLALLWWRLRTVRGDGHGARVLPPDAERARRVWRRARERLERAGLGAGPGRTPAELQQLVRERLPAALPIVERLSQRCSAARWGGAALPAGEAEALLSALGRQLQAK